MGSSSAMSAEPPLRSAWCALTIQRSAPSAVATQPRVPSEPLLPFTMAMPPRSGRYGCTWLRTTTAIGGLLEEGPRPPFELLLRRRVEVGQEVDAGALLDPADRLDEAGEVVGLGVGPVLLHEGHRLPVAGVVLG